VDPGSQPRARLFTCRGGRSQCEKTDNGNHAPIHRPETITAREIILRQLFLIIIGITPSYLVIANIPQLLQVMGITQIDNTMYRFSLFGLAFILAFPVALIILKLWGKALFKMHVITEKEASSPPFNWGKRYF
jgi:hypothetical protein